MSVAAHKQEDAPVSITALQIVKEALSADATPGALARMAEQDPAFALRVMAAVNSAAFGITRRVSDIRQAASLLGVRGLRSLGLSLALSDMIPPGDGSDLLLANCLRRAVSAQLVAEMFGARDRDVFFTAGLFLEVGLLLRARDNLDACVQIARSPALDRPVFERTFGFDEHPGRGAELAAEFHLPEETIEAIRCHHQADPPASLVGRVTWLSERLAGVWEGGDVSSARESARLGCLRLGLTEEQLGELLQKIPEAVTHTSAAFDRDVGAQKSYEALLLDVNRGLVELTNSYEAVVRRLEVLLAEKEELSRRLAEANDSLEHLAHTDALTGLPNKRALEQALTRDLSRADRDKTNLSLVVADVDHFKRVNDTYGHQTGDMILKQVAKALGSNLRTGDLATRYGGEEFVLILPGTNAFGAKLAAERIRKFLERQRYEGGKEPFQVTISLGVASTCGPGCAGSSRELFAQADAALYAAKTSGRNRTMIHGESQPEAAAGPQA